jgi:hypothetical protein
LEDAEMSAENASGNEGEKLAAVGILHSTLIGSFGSFPRDTGNCFAVMANDGNGYKIVNFNYENLKELTKRGVSFPFEIKALSDRVAVIHDARIPDQWYSRRFCEVCCPDSLLPLPQRLTHERQEMQGVRVLIGGGILIKPANSPKVPEA